MGTEMGVRGWGGGWGYSNTDNNFFNKKMLNDFLKTKSKFAWIPIKH